MYANLKKKKKKGITNFIVTVILYSSPEDVDGHMRPKPTT